MSVEEMDQLHIVCRNLTLHYCESMSENFKKKKKKKTRHNEMI